MDGAPKACGPVQCSPKPRLSLKGGATANLGIGLLNKTSIISISDPLKQIANFDSEIVKNGKEMILVSKSYGMKKGRMGKLKPAPGNRKPLSLNGLVQ